MFLIYHIYWFSTSRCLWRRFWGVGEGKGRWSNGRPVNNGKPFSFSNQLLHFSLDTICLRVQRENEVLKPRSLLIKLSPRTRGPKNYSGPRVLTSYFYVCFCAATTGGPYLLLLLLRPFPRNNCRRRWGRYFWDLEGGWGDLGAFFLG
jgi:hypothetical protein